MTGTTWILPLAHCVPELVAQLERYIAMQRIPGITEILLVTDSTTTPADFVPGGDSSGVRHVTVRGDGIVNRARLVNAGARVARGDVLFVCDPGLLLSQEEIEEDLAALDDGVDGVQCAGRLIRLDASQSSLVLAGDPAPELQITADQCREWRWGTFPPENGMVFCIRRAYFDQVGGMDERFRAWGGEDDAILLRMRAGGGVLEHRIERTVLHLFGDRWHDAFQKSAKLHPGAFHANLAYLRAYLEGGDPFVRQLSTDGPANGFDQAGRVHPVEDDAPLVSCLCVTRQRTSLLQNAVEAFRLQTYRPRELLIVFEEDDTETRLYVDSLDDPDIRAVITSRQDHPTLGHLRNLALTEARGDWVCQWDDDDWFAPERIGRQLEAARDAGAGACVLSRWTLMDAIDQSVTVSHAKLWEGSLLARRELVVEEGGYLESSRGEDTGLILRLMRGRKLTTLDAPELYIYRFTGRNTWGRHHFRDLFAASGVKRKHHPSVGVITPTVGDEHLLDCVRSVASQNYPNVVHYLVVDGSEHLPRVRNIIGKWASRVKLCVLPEATGRDGYYGHRIYAAFPILANTDYITYLDEDNFYYPEHVQTLVDTCLEHDLDWGYSLRNIVDYHGRILCRDDCDSLGIWGSWKGHQNHIDTSCYIMKRSLAIRASNLWYRKGYSSEEGDPDKALCRWLLHENISGYVSGKYTVGYRIRHDDSDGRLNYFQEGNRRMQALYRYFPWNTDRLQGIDSRIQFRQTRAPEPVGENAGGSS